MMLKGLFGSVLRSLRGGADAESLRAGERYAMQGQYERAIAALRAAGAPRGAGTANLLGVCHTLLGRYDLALACYDAALSEQPGFADALANAGWTATLLGNGKANGYFRRWIAANSLPAHGAELRAQRVRLEGVELCCVDCSYHDLAAMALRATLARCEFDRAQFLSDRDCGAGGVAFVAIEPIRSVQAYSNFMIHDLHAHVSSRHVLVIQYDGFVLNPHAWDARFLDYDYIGPAVRMPDGRAGGIGGFSLRSRRLLDALRDDPEIQRYDAARAPYAEDIAICCAYRERLERHHGMTFAPADVADRFAAEAIVPTAGVFGFHNLMHLVSLYQNGHRLSERADAGMQVRFNAATEYGALSVQREIELRARGDAWARFLQTN
jgi:tetratricopeptide (TPR) repeat protein